MFINAIVVYLKQLFKRRRLNLYMTVHFSKLDHQSNDFFQLKL